MATGKQDENLTGMDRLAQLMIRRRLAFVLGAFFRRAVLAEYTRLQQIRR